MKKAEPLMNGAQRQKKLKMALEESSPRTSTIKMTNQGSLVSSSTQLRISNIHRSSLPGLLPSPQPIKKLQKLVPRAGISIKTPDQLNQALPKEAKIVPLPKTNGKPVVFVKKPENNVASQKALQLPAQVVVRKILPKPKVPSAVEFLQVATTSSNPINGAPDKFFYRGPGLRIPARPEANRISLQASPAALSKLTAQMNNAGKEAASQEIRISMKETTEYIKALENENLNYKNIISRISVEMEDIRKKFAGWETIMNGVNLHTSSVNYPNVQKVPALRVAPKRTFKIPRFPISNYEAFHVFEKEMTFQRYYDLVFGCISKMLPPAVEKRSLIGFLRRIVTDDLLAQFVWESSAEGFQNRSELSKFYNFQSLLFSLVNKFKALNFPAGVKWQELEVFLKHQIKLSRDRALVRAMHQGLNEEVESEVRKLPEVEDFPLYENSDNDEFEQMLLEKVETISQRGRKRASINYMDMEEGLPAKKKKISVKRPLQVTLKNPPITGPTVSIDVDDDDE